MAHLYPESLRRLVPAGILALLLPSGRLDALGTEEFGNKPVNGQPGWAEGVVAAVNLSTRVYSRWVNGNESFYFRGGTGDLNAALEKFAAVKGDGLEVVVLPQPGGTQSFDGKPVDCDWELHVPSGIYLEMAKREKGTQVFSKRPSLIVFAASKRIALEDLKAPAALPLTGVEEIIGRCIEGMKSADDTVAGQAAYLLGSYVEFATDLQPLLDGLKHKSDYVRVCAAGALARAGHKGRAALPLLRACLEKAGDNYRKGFRDAIEAIESAPEAEAAIEARRRRAVEIRSWIGRRAAVRTVGNEDAGKKAGEQ